MTVEVATFIGDLQPLNPPSTDPRGQGDDHLRLIKQVLQNSFPNLERAYYVPKTAIKSANYSILAADGETTFYTDTTSGGVTYTLPSGLASTDAGWQVHFLKTNSGANPIFIVPATGTLTSGGIAGLSAARRSIPGVRVSAVWNGSAWFITRALALPIGSLIDFDSLTLPPGYEWPNGQTLASASTNYPEYNSWKGSGVTRDMRGVVAAASETLGGTSARGLLTNTSTGFGADPTVLGNIGGNQSHTLTTTEMPAHNHGVNDPTHAHSVTGGTVGGSGSNVVPLNSGAQTAPGPAAGIGIAAAGTGISIQSNGSGGAHSNTQPTIILGKLLVVE